MMRSSLAHSEFGCGLPGSVEAADDAAEGKRFALAAKQITIATNANNKVGIRMVVGSKAPVVELWVHPLTRMLLTPVQRLAIHTRLVARNLAGFTQHLVDFAQVL